MINENISQVNQNYESYRERLTNFGSDFELGLFLYIIRKNLKWVFLLIAIALLGCFLYLRYTAPVYEASTIVQLSKNDKANKILQVEQFYEDRTLSAEIELLKSKLLLEQTVRQLPLQIGYFMKGEFLTNELYKTPSPKVILLEIRDSSIVNQKIYIRYERNQIFRLYRNDIAMSDPFKSGELVKTDYFTATIITPEIDPADEKSSIDEVYFTINHPSSLVSRFRSDLDVKALNPVAQTILISFKDHNPLLARDVVMAHAKQYLKYDKHTREQSASNIIEFIEEQIIDVYQVLSQTEIELKQFLKNNKISDINRLSESYISYFQGYDERIIDLEYEEQLLNEIEKVTLSNPSEIEVYALIPVLMGTNLDNSSLSEMIRDLRSLLIEKEQSLFDITSDHGRIQNLEHQIGIQKRLIKESVETLRNNMDQKREFLEDKFNEYETGFSSLPEKELEYARLQRHFNINEKYYTMLLEKQTEYRISKAGFVPENRILEEARIPDRPIAPNRNMIYSFAIIAVLILSFILIFGKYITHNELTSLHEISKLSHASIGILGMTPKYGNQVPVSQMVIDKNPKSMIAEAFRNIRTNLQFIDSDQKGSKIIAITSTVSGEGKTFIAINLAGIIAFSGKKVIILDLDMRKPKIHIGFGVGNTRGMSTLLVGKDELQNCINQSNVDNLDFITAGPVPPNPSELILNKRTEELLLELKNLYDVIIIDNPPVGMVTDGIPIIQKADFPVYVFRSDYSKKHFVQNVDRLMNENGISRMTVILNGVDTDRQRYGYNYGYGYGYGYGQEYGYYEDTNGSSRKHWFEFWK